MSKFRCVCGETIRISGEVPNPDEWLFIADVAYDQFSGPVDAEALYREFGHAYVCPSSGHLWVFASGFDRDPVGYAPLADA